MSTGTACLQERREIKRRKNSRITVKNTGGGNIKSLRKKIGRFIEEHDLLISIMCIIDGLTSISWLLATENMFVKGISVFVIMCFSECFVRLRIWKGNFGVLHYDRLWNELKRKKREDEYQSDSLRYAKWSFCIGVVLLFIQTLVFVIDFCINL